MARTKVDDKLNVVIGTKAQIEGDTSIPENSIIVVTDEELKADEIAYSVEKNVKEAIDEKQDELIAGDNITIVGNTISASGGGGGGFNFEVETTSSSYITVTNGKHYIVDNENAYVDLASGSRTIGHRCRVTNISSGVTGLGAFVGAQFITKYGVGNVPNGITIGGTVEIVVVGIWQSDWEPELGSFPICAIWGDFDEDV